MISFINKVDNVKWPQLTHHQLNEDVLNMLFIEFSFFVSFLSWINLNTAVVYLCECTWILFCKRIKQAKDLLTLNPFPTHTEHSYYPSCSPYISCYIILYKNCFKNKELLKLVVISFMLITFTFDLSLILWGSDSALSG